MPNDKPSRKDDLDKARVIVGEYGLLIGPAGKQSETVAQGRRGWHRARAQGGVGMAAKPSKPSKPPPAAKAHVAVDPRQCRAAPAH